MQGIVTDMTMLLLNRIKVDLHVQFICSYPEVKYTLVSGTHADPRSGARD